MPPPQDNPESQPTIPDQDPQAPALGGIRGLGQIHQCDTERRRLPDEQPVGRERIDRRDGPPNWSSVGRMIAHSGGRSPLKSHGSGMIRLAYRSGSVLPAKSGNVNVNPLILVVKAGADGSRADRESCAQVSTTAGGSSQLSSSRLVRCSCHGLHLLRVAESTQRYTHIRRALCSVLCALCSVLTSCA